jgi:hypothetical protein
MMEQSTHTTRIEWSTRTPGLIEDPVKAEYMARVEDRWRTSIAKLVDFACRNPEAREAALKAAEYQAVAFGPAAVEAAGRAWDDYHKPFSPPSLEASLKSPTYATGDRQ